MGFSDYQTKSLLSGVLKGQDLGDKDKDKLMDAIENRSICPEGIDSLTKYIYDSVNNASDIDDFLNTIDYAISQLKKAKLGVHEPII
jgi:hypothetical protein